MSKYPHPIHTPFPDDFVSIAVEKNCRTFMKIFFFIVEACLRIGELSTFYTLLCYCGRLFTLLWKIVDKIGLSLGRNESKLLLLLLM